MPRDPHKDQPVFVWGAPFDDASGAVIAMHGRGAAVDDVRSLSTRIDRPRLAYVAPAAHGRSWYPYSLLEPISRNAAHLNSALRLLRAAIEKVTTGGIPPHQIMLLGASQGACVVLEFAARNVRRYGAVVGLSGALMGPDGTSRDYEGDFEGMPVFLGCGDVDPHVPRRRVLETEGIFRGLGATVTTQVYRGMGHTTNDDEVAVVQAMLDAMLATH